MTIASNDLGLLPESEDTIPLFWPHVTEAMRRGVAEQLQTRWLGQGPAVAQFEDEFKTLVLKDKAQAVAVSSGTAALHLAYLLALDAYWPGRGNRQLDGEVICPVFTCTATNLPWLYLGLDIMWADVDPLSMNAAVDSIASLIGPRTRAISVVHYGGYPADIKAIRKLAAARGIPVIEDAAQALGAEIDGEPVGTLS